MSPSIKDVRFHYFAYAMSYEILVSQLAKSCIECNPDFSIIFKKHSQNSISIEIFGHKTENGISFYEKWDGRSLEFLAKYFGKDHISDIMTFINIFKEGLWCELAWRKVNGSISLSIIPTYLQSTYFVIITSNYTYEDVTKFSNLWLVDTIGSDFFVYIYHAE